MVDGGYSVRTLERAQDSHEASCLMAVAPPRTAAPTPPESAAAAAAVAAAAAAWDEAWPSPPSAWSSLRFPFLFPFPFPFPFVDARSTMPVCCA